MPEKSRRIFYPLRRHCSANFVTVLVCGVVFLQNTGKAWRQYGKAHEYKEGGEAMEKMVERMTEAAEKAAFGSLSGIR